MLNPLVKAKKDGFGVLLLDLKTLKNIFVKFILNDLLSAMYVHKYLELATDIERAGYTMCLRYFPPPHSSHRDTTLFRCTGWGGGLG